MTNPTAAQIVLAHVVRSPRCGCARHWRDGWPEPCSAAYRELPYDQRTALAELRVGIYRPDASLPPLKESEDH
jgi:hypothetical protein